MTSTRAMPIWRAPTQCRTPWSPGNRSISTCWPRGTSKTAGCRAPLNHRGKRKYPSWIIDDLVKYFDCFFLRIQSKKYPDLIINLITLFNSIWMKLKYLFQKLRLCLFLQTYYNFDFSIMIAYLALKQIVPLWMQCWKFVICPILVEF